MANRWGNWKQWQTLFSWARQSLQMVTATMKLKDACSLEEKLWPTKQHIKKQRHYFANKGLSSQGYGFSSRHVWMWELDYKESWAQKNWCLWTVVLLWQPKRTNSIPLSHSPHRDSPPVPVSAAAAKSLQLCPTLCDPIDGRDSLGKNTGVGCHFLLQCMKVKSESEVTQSCLTLSNPMDCSLPGSSVHGIFQERVLEWGAINCS